jgi:uncharacterized caspase-like protein
VAAKRTYRALLIGNGTFPEDPQHLRALRGPANDVALLMKALTNSQQGLHNPTDVDVLVDEPKEQIVEAMETFFSAAQPNDQLLLYYSGHGIPDRQDRLYLCARNTRTDRLVSRAISDQEISRIIEASKSQAIAIIMDCCYSGNFKTAGPDPADRLGGAGRFVLTSSRQGELSDDAQSAQDASAFTRHLVAGLLAGPSIDRDHDGLITIADLHAHVSERLTTETGQRPHQQFDGEGQLPLGRATPRSVSLIGQAIRVPPLLHEDVLVELPRVYAND